jgi:hypothetical protein
VLGRHYPSEGKEVATNPARAIVPAAVPTMVGGAAQVFTKPNVAARCCDLAGGRLSGAVHGTMW